MCRRVCCVVHSFLCVYVATMELVDLIDKEVLSVAVPQYSLRQICPEEFRGACPFLDIPLGRVYKLVPGWWEGVRIVVSVGRLWELVWGGETVS